MRVQLGIWAVAENADPGEISWAGGVPDWSQKPFTAAFHSLEVDDYQGWCEEKTEDGDGRVEYQYDGGMKGWADVRVAGCRKRRDGAATAPSPSGTSSSASTSASATETAHAEPTDKDGDKKGDGSDDSEGSGAVMAPSASLAFMVSLGGLLFFW